MAAVAKASEMLLARCCEMVMVYGAIGSLIAPCRFPVPLVAGHLGQGIHKEKEESETSRSSTKAFAGDQPNVHTTRESERRCSE